MELKPGYKQTEVGMIPEDWDCVSLQRAASSAANAIVGGPFGSDLTSSDYVYSGVPVVRGTNMGTKMFTGPFVFVSTEKATALTANLARPKDVIFTQRGTLGQVSLVPEVPFESYLISQVCVQGSGRSIARMQLPVHVTNRGMSQPSLTAVSGIRQQ